MNEKVKVTTRFGIRIRSQPKIEKDNIVGKVPQGFVSDVFEFHQGDRYPWAKIGEGKWIVADERVVDIIPVPIARIKINYTAGKYVFDKPDFDSKVVWLAKKDNIYKVYEFIMDLDDSPIWALIGRNEWVSIINQDVSVLEISEYSDKIRVIINHLRIRSAPQVVAGNIVGFADKGDTFEVLEYANDADFNAWAKIGNDQWISSNTRFAVLVGPLDFQIGAWPTEQVFYPGTHAVAIEVNFGIPSPEYDAIGMPGNPGLDLFAPKDTEVYSIYKGYVSSVGDRGGGTHVEINHTNGFTSRYSNLGDRWVGGDAIVEAGYAIGMVGEGENIHFSMTHEDGQDGWPNGIIDPTDILMNHLRESLS